MIIPQKQWREENGASHRLYLDTPPLKGWRSLPMGSDCYRERNQQIKELAIANGINRYRDLRTLRRPHTMSKMLGVDDTESISRPAVRSRQIGVRLTDAEYEALEKLAWKSGRTIGDWSREQLLMAIAMTESAPSSTLLLTEIIGLQIFLTNALAPLLQGARMSDEQYQDLMRHVKANKLKAAQEVLAQKKE
jgi:hypothetical protein